MVQPLISDVAKNLKMSSNIAKRKREDEEPEVHCEEDWDEELYSNSINYVMEIGKWPLSASFCIAKYIMVSVQSVIWVIFLKGVVK